MTFASLLNALLFVAAGTGVFALGLVMLVRLLPGNLWSEAIEKQNIAAAIVLAAIALALGWIVAAAVH